MKRVRIVALAVVGAAVVTAVVMACNGGGNTPASACTGYCEHVLNCNGLSGSAVDNACQQNCADAAGYAAAACGDAAALTNYFNCLEGLPCSDYALGDGGFAADAIVACVSQSGCL